MDERRVICLDVYNMASTGIVSKTLNASRSDYDHVPVIAIDHAITTGGNCTAQGPCVYEDICPTEKASGVHAVCYEMEQSNTVIENSSGGEIAATLDSHYYKGCGEREGIEREIVAYERDWYSCGNGQSVTIGLFPVMNTLDCMHDQKFIVGVGPETNGRRFVVRRLTPVECARLQGFPDWWTDGANGSDSAIYKMWGNGIALPCAADVIGRLAKELEKTTSE